MLLYMLIYGDTYPIEKFNSAWEAVQLYCKLGLNTNMEIQK